MKTQTETTHIAVIGSKAQKVRFKGPSMMHAGNVDTQDGIQQSSVCVRDEKKFPNTRIDYENPCSHVSSFREY